ncbi:right-handed parallel beta-helix repeat-containing protein, partial [Candidatus Woesearchaeota archaeon]|nr:right-handed parallel beta-helix repeat-containing protein [Candidatus Woesearchaeota archaeon]
MGLHKRALLVLGLIVLLIIVGVAKANVEGQDTDVSIYTEKFDPLIWLCDSRIMLDDNLQWGRYSPEGEELIERHNNYIFEGEQLQWTTLVMDKNGADKISDVYVELVRGDQTNCPNITGCFGTPSAGSCENYGISQCSSIQGCLLVCDIYVDDMSACSGSPCYSSIQSAIDSALSGETICVQSGIYTEQIIINKNINLIGIDQPQIISPSLRNTYTFPESSRTWDPVVFAFGGTESSGAISGTDVISVLIEGFIIDGQADFRSGTRYSGILFRNVDGTVRSNIVQNIGVDGTETFGIIVHGDSDVLVEHNQVSDYARGGIGINGDLDTSYDIGPYPDPTAVVRYNTVTGPGLGVPVTWAPNGIQFGYGATGDIYANSVTGNGWPGTAWAGSGIIVVDTHDVIIEQNDVFSNEAAINVGEYWNPAADCQIIDNSVHNNEWGISVFNDASNIVVQGNNVVD